MIKKTIPAIVFGSSLMFGACSSDSPESQEQFQTSPPQTAEVTPLPQLSEATCHRLGNLAIGLGSPESSVITMDIDPNDPEDLLVEIVSVGNEARQLKRSIIENGVIPFSEANADVIASSDLAISLNKAINSYFEKAARQEFTREEVTLGQDPLVAEADQVRMQVAHTYREYC